MKRIISLAAVLALCALCCVPCFAAVIDTDTFIFDYAGVLSADAENTVNYALSQVNASCITAFAIVTMPKETSTSLDDYSNEFMTNTPELSGPRAPIALFVFDTVANDYDAVTYFYSDDEVYIKSDYIDLFISLCQETCQSGDYETGLQDLANNVFGMMVFGDLADGAEFTLPDDFADFTVPEVIAPVPGETVANNTPASNEKFVIDDAELLTDEQIQKLNAKIGSILEKYDYQVVIHTCNDFYGKSAMDYADDYYDYNGYKDDGMIFVINMTTRDYWTSTKGFGITAFTDYGLEQMHNSILTDLGTGYYYNAFIEYLSICDDYLAKAKAGHPVDVGSDKWDLETIMKGEFIILVIAVIIALIAGKKQKDALNTARIKTEADSYMIDGSLRLTGQNEMFVRRHVTKTRKAESKSSGGGSSTHHSSSGSSHGGGGGKF